MIPYGRQDIQDADIAAVNEVLKSPFLTQGPMVPKFEAAVCEATGAAHAVAVNSATSALHIAYMALGLGPDDVLWTCPNTFVATANAALYCGAKVDFVDCDPRTYNMSPSALETKLKAADTLPKIVSVVHFAGQSAEMAEIHRLSQTYGFHIVEDASHAIGGSYDGQPVGNCRFSNICVFSFHPVKIVTTAEGGVATTQDADLATAMELFRSHGVTRRGDLMRDKNAEPWVYEQLSLGYNYRMTDLHAALGVTQMARLIEYVDARHAIRERYDAALADLPLVLPFQHSDQRSALHLYPIQVTSHDRRAVFDFLREAGIGVNVHYIPVHTQPYYRELGFDWGDCPEAEKYYQRAISLPMFPTMSGGSTAQVIDAMRNSLS